MLLSVVYYSPVVSLVSPGVTKLGKQALWNYRMIYWRCKFIVGTRRCVVILFEVVILSHVSVVWFAVHRGCLITQRGWPSPTDCGRCCPAEAGAIPSAGELIRGSSTDCLPCRHTCSFLRVSRHFKRFSPGKICAACLSGQFNKNRSQHAVSKKSIIIIFLKNERGARPKSG